MKWFKCDCDGYRSEGVNHIRADFGMAGVAAWYILLMMIGEKMKRKSDRCHIELPLAEFCRTLEMTPRAVLDFLFFLQNIKIGQTSVEVPAKLQQSYANVTAKLRIDCRDVAQTLVKISVPNMLKKRDEYSKKSGQLSGQDSDKDTPKREEERYIHIRGEDEEQPTRPKNEFTGDIPVQVVRILNRIGDRAGIDAYKRITEKDWREDLVRAGQKIGFQCLLQQAEKFEHWFIGKVESGEIQRGGKHVPRTRFLGSWLGRTKQDEWTNGDSPQGAAQQAVDEPERVYPGGVRFAIGDQV